MKRLFFLAFTLLLLISCGPKQEKVERYMEDGVEVIVNHLEPYKVKEEPSNLILEEEFTIDTEKDEIAELGLTDIFGFNVDSEGNIYIVNIQSKENLFFNFDRKGNFTTSFIRKGQGPGEIHFPKYPKINKKDQIEILDAKGNKASSLISVSKVCLEPCLILGTSTLLSR